MEKEKITSSRSYGPTMTRSIFIESLVGNIKEKYFFEKKLGSGGYGAVYLAKDRKTGKSTEPEE
jgi:serine/threonine protein kinase